MDDIATFAPGLPDPFGDPATDPVFWRPTRLDVPSAWHAHVPFAFWLVSQTAPRLLVELGAHHGVSYAAFCEAVRRGGMPTRCFAVDTWQGDKHAGFYGEAVFAGLRSFHDPLYGDFSTLLRLDFAAAATRFADGSIDLLHIDGAHDYDSVRQDFETWLPKLSERAVVLFHDTNVRSQDFGVWRLFAELRERYPAFEFLHASGLGVLAVGPEVPEGVAALCRLADASVLRRVRERFAATGERWVAESALMQAAGPSRPTLASAGNGALRISVVIPLYNGARFIAEALESVFAQTLPPSEIIVVDDGSTDAGADLVRRLAAGRPLTLLQRPNGGQSSARNLGIRHASGTHVALLDQDDIWYPEHLEALAQPFLTPRIPPLGWTYSNLDEIDEGGAMVAQSYLRLLPFHHPKRDLFACLSNDMFVLPSASLVSREALLQVGGFDEALCGYEDDDLFLRLFRAGYDNVFIDRALSRWRIHPGGSSYSSRMAESRMVYLRKLLDAFPDDLPRERRYRRDMLAPRFLLSVAKDYRMAVETGDAVTIAAAARDLARIARMHRWRVRIAMAAVMPVLRSPRLAPMALPVLLALRPVGRRLGGARRSWA